MGLEYRHLDSLTRQLMLGEIDNDIAHDSLYLSSRLNSQGRHEWPNLLRTAAQLHNDGWLGARLRASELLVPTESYVRLGRVHIRGTPLNAADILAEGEFNRFYIRGLCIRAQAEGIESVIVYRARHSAHPRSESRLLLGGAIAPAALLSDLRVSKGREPELLPNVNSGLSVRLP